VFGFEFQGDWANLRGQQCKRFAPSQYQSVADGCVRLVHGTGGYAFNTALIYLKGGAAVVADRNDILAGGVVAGDIGRRQPLGRNCRRRRGIQASPRTGRRRLNTTICHPPTTTRRSLSTTTVLAVGSDRIRGDADIATVRINYRWGGPVIAEILIAA